jgi:hypothetical protein
MLVEQQIRRMERAELHFLRAGAGCRMTDHKHNGDITRKLAITDIKAAVKYYQKILLELLEL